MLYIINFYVEEKLFSWFFLVLYDLFNVFYSNLIIIFLISYLVNF